MIPIYVGFIKALKIGRPKLYEGKVKFDDLSIFKLSYEGVKLYTSIVNSPRFKRNLPHCLSG